MSDLLDRLRTASRGEVVVEPRYGCYFDALDGTFGEAATALDVALALLREAEWGTDEGFCPVCDYLLKTHSEDCRLAAFLAAHPEEKS